ncbi:(2Fe-2S)-binding protein [Ammoniphilus sp. CFH 90114]|uniref:(2Fe-2S)-binding protein n=1 Tax=Ammoniphilus sp. CFH 90114 TaxID=2493665 RepID=UPI00100F8034|nr:(2Fe-2S)-binding protein [Ammoniphilus sp. CFH 90114]RXT06415.1 (2Fe-2S)-binding protein [Ammoniphilus sp. CFH 90114]
MAVENVNVSFSVNGVQKCSSVEPRKLLVHHLRDDLGLTGTHIGCDTSQCGACTVMVNGEAVKSCTVLTVQVEGSQVLTVEGLGTMQQLHPIQKGFWEEHGLQCGFCTPGVMIAMVNLLDSNPNPTDEEIRDGLEGVICRCTGYQHIVNAVKHAAQLIAESKKLEIMPIGEGS